jgi:hypothetical protein
MKNRKSVQFFAFLLLTCFLTSSNYAQKNKLKKDVFADVPENIRARLSERLNLFIQYQYNKQWDKVYDMLSEQSKPSIQGGQTKDSFIKTHSRGDLVKFSPKSISLMWGTKDDGTWMIEGCGEYDTLGPNEKLKSAIEATRQSGD